MSSSGPGTCHVRYPRCQSVIVQIFQPLIDVMKENVLRFIAIFKGVYKSENNPITALFFIRKDVIPPVLLLESFRRIDATSSWSIVDCE